MFKISGWFYFLPMLLLTTAFFCTSGHHYKALADSSLQATSVEPVVVLELFTSQGCSSCPPADALLKRLKQEAANNRLFPIEYHVDYWDYMGWEDPYSKAEYTEKQRRYATKFRSGSIYTPQMVINGVEGMVGSDVAKIRGRIQEYTRGQAANAIGLSLKSISAASIEIGYQVEGIIENRNIRAVLVLDERTTEVRRGENRNRGLTNTNIAVAETRRSLEAPEGEISLKVPPEVRKGEMIHLIVLTESDNGDITGAGKLTLKIPE